MNFYESELRKVLRPAIDSGCLTEMGDSSSYFSQIMRHYPVDGSKIDWGLVPQSIERCEGEEALRAGRFVEFFDQMVGRFGLVGDVVYVGDSATDFALGGALNCMRDVLRELLAIPQHHYFVGPECSWCLCLTMEGYMGFGFRPLPAKIQ